jgi:hypothetical protein
MVSNDKWIDAERLVKNTARDEAIPCQFRGGERANNGREVRRQSMIQQTNERVWGVAGVGRIVYLI